MLKLDSCSSKAQGIQRDLCNFDRCVHGNVIVSDNLSSGSNYECYQENGGLWLGRDGAHLACRTQGWLASNRYLAFIISFIDISLLGELPWWWTASSKISWTCIAEVRRRHSSCTCGVSFGMCQRRWYLVALFFFSMMRCIMRTLFEGVAALAENKIYATLLPTTAYILRLEPPPARKVCSQIKAHTFCNVTC